MDIWFARVALLALKLMYLVEAGVAKQEDKAQLEQDFVQRCVRDVPLRGQLGIVCSRRSPCTLCNSTQRAASVYSLLWAHHVRFAIGKSDEEAGTIMLSKLDAAVARWGKRAALEATHHVGQQTQRVTEQVMNGVNAGMSAVMSLGGW